MARTMQMQGRQVRPSTRGQTLGVRRKVLRSSNMPKLVTPPKSKSKARPQPPPTTRVLRSTTNPTSSPLPGSVSPKPQPTRTPHRRRTRSDPWQPKRRSKKDRKPRTPPPTHFTCRICAEERPVADFIKYVSPLTWRRRRLFTADIPYGCIAHLARNPYRRNDEPVCRTCIGQSMAAKHDLVGARKVSAGCLEPGCDQHWDFDYIMRFFPAGEPLEKYNHDMFNVYLADTKLFTCTACETKGLADPNNTPGYPNIQCPNADCAKRFCVACNVPWHTDLTCSEYSARHVDATMTDPERDTLKFMQDRDGKRCPNCYLVIEKDGGCDSMYCEGCKKYFNWATAASAVLGAKKAAPVVNGWAASTEVVCEMDALERAAGSAEGKGEGEVEATGNI